MDVLICRVPKTGDAAAPSENNGLEGVAGDAAAAALALAPNENPVPEAVVGVAEGGAPNGVVWGIDNVGLGAPNWKPDPVVVVGVELAAFASPNLNEDDAGAAGGEPNAGVAAA